MTHILLLAQDLVIMEILLKDFMVQWLEDLICLTKGDLQN